MSAAADRRVERAARRWTGDPRSARQLREHYAIERALATQLRQSSKGERGALYASVYDELFRRIPHHPQLQLRSSEHRARRVERELHFLAPLLSPRLTFMEIGAGDLALSRRVAELVDEVHAIDVAAEILAAARATSKLHVHLTDGRQLPLPDNSISFAYSNQLMEHLHPDDAAEQLCEVFRVLRPGGSYLCVTPNRLTGPWDISRVFSPTVQGLHLREYSNRELVALLHDTGFVRISALVPGRSRARELPSGLFTGSERAFELFGPGASRLLLRGPWRKPFNTVRLLARKPVH